MPGENLPRNQQTKFTYNHWLVESCGAKFLAPPPRIAPLSFAPTRTGPKNSKFYGPDPGPTRLYFPRTEPKQFSINTKLTSFDPGRPENSEVRKIFCVEINDLSFISDYNKHENIPCNEVITSKYVLIKDNNHSISSFWE